MNKNNLYNCPHGFELAPTGKGEGCLECQSTNQLPSWEDRFSALFPTNYGKAGIRYYFNTPSHTVIWRDDTPAEFEENIKAFIRAEIHQADAEGFARANKKLNAYFEKKMGKEITTAEERTVAEIRKGVTQLVTESAPIKDLFEKGTRYLALADVLELLASLHQSKDDHE